MLDIKNRIKRFIFYYKTGKLAKYLYKCLDCNKKIYRTSYEERSDKSFQYCAKCIIKHKKSTRIPLDKNGDKLCNTCLRYLPTNKFIKKGNCKIGFSAACSKCHNVREFGINSLDYEKLVIKQNNKCAICRKPETANDKHKNYKRALAVDHYHTTNKVRGLLCTNCNLMLGHCKDNIKILEKAIKYLKKNEK